MSKLRNRNGLVLEVLVTLTLTLIIGGATIASAVITRKPTQAALDRVMDNTATPEDMTVLQNSEKEMARSFAIANAGGTLIGSSGPLPGVEKAGTLELALQTAQELSSRAMTAPAKADQIPETLPAGIVPAEVSPSAPVVSLNSVQQTPSVPPTPRFENSLVGTVWRAWVQYKDMSTPEYEVKCLSHDTDGKVTATVIRITPYKTNHDPARLVKAKGQMVGDQLTLDIPYYSFTSAKSEVHLPPPRLGPGSGGKGLYIPARAASVHEQWNRAILRFDPTLKSAQGIFGKEFHVVAKRIQ